MAATMFAVAGTVACDEDKKASPSADSKAPTTGAALQFSNLGATSLTVGWGAASDDVTAADELLYKVVRSSDASKIDTLEEVAAISDTSELVLDFTRGVTSANVAALTPATSYAFAVVVRDAAGNSALYAPASVDTLDASAPTPGAAISVSNLGATSLSLSWGAASDDATAPDALQYKVVMADTAAELDTLAEAAAITAAPRLIKDFTAGLTTVPVTGLSSSKSYAFAVVVRDARGNQALYAPVSVATPDVTPPTAGTPVAFGEITASSLSVSWGAATDAVTAAAELQYKLVRADDGAQIDTLDEADAITSAPGLVADYGAGRTSATVSGLESATRYAFAVIVRDGAGNRALYAPASVMTLDATAPVTGGAITIGNVSASGLTLSWPAASDDVTAANELEYKVVQASATASIDTLEEIAAITSSPGLLRDFAAGVTTQTVSGLSSGTLYAFAVVVRDQQGHQALYTPVWQRTVDDTAPVPGTALSFSNLAATSLTLTWGAASDDVTATGALQYKVVTAAAPSALDTLAKADAITTAPGLVLDYTAGVTSRNVTGLNSSSPYAYAVIVRDAAGNRALYAPGAVTTLDVSAPVPGTPISFSNVTVSQIDVAWGAASDDTTAANALEYKLVRGVDAAAIDTIAEIDAITSGPALIADYTANLTSRTVTGLSGSTSYAFAVAVRDGAGNRAVYTPGVRSTLDGTAPTPGTAVSFSQVLADGVTVNWGAASDDVSAAGELQYKLVGAYTAAEIDTLAEAAAVSGIGLVQDFTSNLSSVTVSGLDSSTSYAFAVVVRDAAGNQALYAPSTITTLDVSAPTPGMALSFSAVTSSSITVGWGAASDDLSAPSALAYKLVRGANSAAIDTLGEVDAITSGPNLITDFTVGLTSATASSLASSTTYAFAVVVRDEAGNRALYAPRTQATLDVSGPTAGTGIVVSNVAASSLTLTWGAASDDISAAGDLQYKVVRAATSASIDTVQEAAAISGPGLLQNYTTNLTSFPVTGLSSSTSYAFAVLVRDQAGNESLYAPVTATTTDVTAPSTGTAISFSALSSNGVTVSWGAASDDVTAAASLQYKLVRASSTTAIDTVTEVDAITGGALVQDYTANLTTRAVTGLSQVTTYAFAVVVRDAAGNKALYTPAATTTLDGTAPALGSAIRFRAVTSSGVTVSWGAASDNITAQTALQYRLVRANSASDIDTTAKVAALIGADVLVDWTANALSYAVSGLTQGSSQFYAVAVRDADGNLSLYAPLSRVIGRYLYLTTNPHIAAFGGLAAVDAYCGSARDPRAATDVTPKAVVASSGERYPCTTSNCTNPSQNLDWPLLASTPYYNTQGQTIGTTNLAGIILTPWSNAIAPGSDLAFYSGMSSSWVPTGEDCGKWTSNGSDHARTGLAYNTDNSALSGSISFCDSFFSDDLFVLCAEP